MALDANERQSAFAVARRYMNAHDAGIHVTDPMLNGLLDVIVAALEAHWAEKAAPAKPKAGAAKAADA